MRSGQCDETGYPGGPRASQVRVAAQACFCFIFVRLFFGGSVSAAECEIVGNLIHFKTLAHYQRISASLRAPAEYFWSILSTGRTESVALVVFTQK